MSILTILVLRSLRWSEGALSEMDGPLAEAAFHDVHNARICIETLARVTERNSLANHVTGERGEWAA